MKKKDTLKLVLLLTFITVAAVAIYLARGRITFDAVRAGHERLVEFYHNHRLTVSVGYFLFYIFCVVFAVPVALALTILAGAVFGLLFGTVLVSFASSIGAGLSFLVARYLLRDWVERTFGDKLARVHAGLRREGPFYLFTLRIIPLMPYFILNPLFGLTRMKFTTFYWVSQLGMLPGTLIFVNAGTQLAKVDSPREIMSWQLWLSLLLVALFPLIARKIINRLRVKKAACPS